MKIGNLVAWLLALAMAVLAMVLSGGFWLFINIPSLFVVLGISYFMGIASFGLKDCHLAIKGMFSVFSHSIPDGLTIRHIDIIRSLRWYIFLAGLYATLTGLIGLLSLVDELKTIIPSLAVTSLTLFVSLFLILFLCQPALAFYRHDFFNLRADNSQNTTPLATQAQANDRNINANQPNSSSNKAPSNGFPWLNIILILVTASIAFYIGKGSAPQLVTTKTSTTPSQQHAFIYRLKPITVNLNGSDNAFYYLKTEISLSLDSDFLLAELKQHQDPIYDQILSILSTQSIASLKTEAGKNHLKAELKQQLNRDLKQGQIKQVLFRSLLIK